MGGVVRNINLECPLPVPSVQELAKKLQPEMVPPRYLRDDIAAVNLSDDPHHAPLIDMSKLVNPDSQRQQEKELQRLHSACKHWGVFQVYVHA